MTNQPAAPKPPRKSRKKKQWNSEIARQTYSNMRRKLAREASEREASALDAARAELRAAKGRLLQAENTRRVNMVANGLTPRLQAVMSSWGLVMPINLSATDTGNISAYTDFEKIVVNYDRRLTSRNLVDQVPVSDEALRQIAAETRGLFYHEVGHNLFSTPLNDLLTFAWLDGFKGSNFLFPTIDNRPTDREYINDGSAQASNITWPRWSVGTKFQHAWNVLEDQRMEMALVEESPQIAAYLTVLVLRKIVSNSYSDERTASAWGLVAGRKYLPARTRMAARAAWMKTYPDIDADDLADVIDQYLEAETPADMLAQIEAFIDLTENTAQVEGFDAHGYLDQSNGSAPKEDGREQIAETGEKASKALAQDDDETDDDDEGEPFSLEADEAEGDDEGSGPAMPSDDEGDDDEEGGEGFMPGSPDDEDDAEGDAEGSKGSSKGDDDGDDLDDLDGEGGGDGVGDQHQEKGNPAKTAHDDLEDVLDKMDDDETINDDVAAMNGAYETDDGSLSTYPEASPQRDEDTVAKAHAIVDDFIRAFNIATADSAPHWESGQRRGVLEPIRYRTRQPGDMEFFRQYTEAGDPGTDITVSIFLDVSGSMELHVDDLGAAAWAAKKSCEIIGVDCDVTLFDTAAWKLWSAEETVDVVPTLHDHGGTNPDYAFASILHDERDKKHHLVLIMTDGGWTNHDVLRRYLKDNMRTMVFNFKKNGQAMESNERMATQLSVDEAYDTGDLYDVPRALESMLISML